MKTYIQLSHQRSSRNIKNRTNSSEFWCGFNFGFCHWESNQVNQKCGGNPAENMNYCTFWTTQDQKKKLNKALYPSNTIAFIIRFGIIVAVKLWKQYTTENASHWNQHLFFNVYVPFLYKTAAKVQLGLRAGGHILNGCKCGTAPALGGFSPLLNSVPQLETDLFPPSVYRKNLFGAFVWVSGWDFFFKDVWKWETEALERSQDLLVSLSPRQSPPPKQLWK